MPSHFKQIMWQIGQNFKDFWYTIWPEYFWPTLILIILGSILLKILWSSPKNPLLKFFKWASVIVFFVTVVFVSIFSFTDEKPDDYRSFCLYQGSSFVSSVKTLVLGDKEDSVVVAADSSYQEEIPVERSESKVDSSSSEVYGPSVPGFFEDWKWIFKILSILLPVVVVLLIFKYSTTILTWVTKTRNIIMISLASASFIIWGLVVYQWYTSLLLYEIIFASVILILSGMLFRRVIAPRNLAPLEEPDSVVPYAFEASKNNSSVSVDGEPIAEYEARRQEIIDQLNRENEPYKKHTLKLAVASLLIMTALVVAFIFVNPFMVLAFLIWAIYLGFKLVPWLRDTNDERKFFHIYSPWYLGLRLLGAYLLAIIFTWLVNSIESYGSFFSDVLITLAIFVLFTALMIAAYFLGCLIIVPIRRRWVFTIFHRVVKASKLILYTPDIGNVMDDVSGLHTEETKRKIQERMRAFNVSGDNWLDAGINVSIISWLFVGIVDIISNYFMVVEVTKQTRLLPTKGFERSDLATKTKAAGTISYFFRYFIMLGVDPLVASRLSPGERYEIIPTSSKIIEGHIANVLKRLTFDEAMIYPFHESNPSINPEEDPEEYIRLMVRLNEEFLGLTGSHIMKFNVIDRDPEEGIQKAMDELTASYYKLDNAVVNASRTVVEGKAAGEATGKGEAERIAAVQKILASSRAKEAMELLIRMTGADKASIYRLLDYWGNKNSGASS